MILISYTPNAEEYYKLTRNKFGIESFQAMLDFAKEATKYVPEVREATGDKRGG